MNFPVPVRSDLFPEAQCELRDTQQYIMQVIALYGSSVIAYDQLQRGQVEQFTLGFGIDADCAVPSEVLPVEGAYPLAETTGDDHMLVNIPYDISGEVLYDQHVFDLSQLRDTGRLLYGSVTGSDTLVLPQDARCRVHIGEFTFIVSAIPSPEQVPRLSLRERIDLSMMSSMGGVMIFVILMLSVLSLIPQSPNMITLAHLNAVERYVTLDLEVKEELSEAKHLLSESTDTKRASSHLASPGRVRHQMISEDFSSPHDDRASRGDRRQLAQDAANEILSVAWGVFSDTEAVSAEALSAFIGNSNTHVTSNSISDLGHITLSKTDFIDQVHSSGPIKISHRPARVQTCLTTRRCHHKGKRPQVKPLPPRVERGALSRAQIRRVILNQKRAYQHCYELQLQRHRRLQGKLELLIHISGRGDVILARIDERTMDNAQVERCILRRVRSLKFPAAEGQRSTVVRYPLRFESQ